MKIKKTFPVVGMSCASCAARIDKVIHEQPGVYEANINYATAQAQVVYDTEICSVQALKNAVQDAGYDLLIETDQQGEEKAKQIQNEKYRLLKIQTFGAILLSLPIMVISMVFVNIPYMNYVLWFLSTCVVLGFGNRFYLSAWQQLKHGTSNMDTLVANSTGIAYLFSVFNLLFPDFWLSRGITPHLYFEAASGIIAFILLGRLLEERAKQNTSTAIRRLAGLQPKTITIVTGSGEQTVPIENARIGDTIAVKPGERIAADGTVISGDSYVDESMLSGEPIAVHKQAGEKVYAGMVIGQNPKGDDIEENVCKKKPASHEYLLNKRKASHGSAKLHYGLFAVPSKLHARGNRCLMHRKKKLAGNHLVCDQNSARIAYAQSRYIAERYQYGKNNDSGGQH